MSNLSILIGPSMPTVNQPIRFPQGESGLDVYNRATSFIATMFRDFANENIARDDLNVIIVTHGLTLRLVRRV